MDSKLKQPLTVTMDRHNNLAKAFLKLEEEHERLTRRAVTLTVLVGVLLEATSGIENERVEAWLKRCYRSVSGEDRKIVRRQVQQLLEGLEAE